MKKIMDSKFLFIVALSLVVLIVLGVGAFYLFDDSDATFVKNGYVLNPLSAKNEKYFFDENTSYKENLSSMVEFKDVDNVEVAIMKDSFIHYMDGSLSFLKNGAILDLDSIEGTKAVDFYNITNKSLIEKDGKNYRIAAKNGDINLKHFIGRISDKKYIVVGNLEAKIPGNNTNVKADYFEIVYTEEGIVNLENKDNKFQVTAEGTLIYAGDVVIDLGSKKITKGDNDVMSITAITIDGNENIEIIPKAPSTPSDASASDNGGGNGGNNPTDNTPSAPSQGGNETSQDGEGEVATVELKKVTTGSTYADLMFDIKNGMADDVFNLKVTNLDTGRTVNKFDNVKANETIPVSGLTPGTKYLFTLENQKDGGKYSQKIIETKGFGISLTRNFVTADSLAYAVTVAQDSDVLDATLSLMKYNEITKQLELVKATYKDADDNDVVRDQVVKLSDLAEDITGTHEKIFYGLESNTLYTVVLNNVVVGGGNNGSVYEMSQTDLTLKKAPDVTLLNAVKGVDNKSFNLQLEGINDPDNAIISYTYRIYEKGNTTTPAITPIVRNDASPISVPFGNGANELKNDDDGTHKYIYRVVIKYFDNEKEVEIITSDSISFSIGTDPYITVVSDDSWTTYNSTRAKVYILDNSCTINMPGRECDGDNTARVRLSYGDSSTKNFYRNLSQEECTFNISNDEIMCEFELSGLEEGTRYYVDVDAIRNDHTTGIPEEIEHTSDSVKYVVTKTLSEFTVDWNLAASQAKSNKENVIYIDPKLLRNDNIGTLLPDETASIIKKVRFQLYEGDDVVSVMDGLKDPIASFAVTEDIKDKLYDNRYPITIDMFGLTYDEENNYLVTEDLRTFKLKENYTIAMSAYYDSDKRIKLSNYVTPYKVSPLLFIDDLEDSKIVTTPIKNSEAKELGISSDIINNYLANDGTVVGYHVNATFDLPGLISHNFSPDKIRLYVDDADGNSADFYVVENGTLKRVSEDISFNLQDGYYEKDIYMVYGREAVSDNDNIMRRGEAYTIGFSLGINIGSSSVENGTGDETEKLTALKEEPIVVTYPYTSTSGSITYHYDVKDPDATIAKDGADYNFYYKINDENERKVVITKTDGNYNMFSGDDLALTSLAKTDVYNLYYKEALVTGGDATFEYVAESAEGRLFDGVYDAADYNFSYQIINHEETDNRVMIKILADDSVIDRIVAYHVKLTSPAKNYDTKKLVLDTCYDGTQRCLIIDYIDIKQMKSEIGHENLITVSVDAYYDTGLTGFGFEVGNDKPNKYMIFQNNNANGAAGQYITYSLRGQITNWVHDIKVPKGYYTYEYVDTNRDGIDEIQYNSIIYGHDVSFEYLIDQDGYHAGSGLSIGTLNPKMVNKYEMTSTQNTFSFYSITPTININRLTRVINGAHINMKLEGVDTDEIKKDFCDNHDSGNCVSNPNATKHLYIETWASENDANEDTDFSRTVRPTYEVSLLSDPRTAVDAKLYELNNDTQYYYRVYAYMNKEGKSVYTQLFGNTGEALTYSFKTLSSRELFVVPAEEAMPIDYLIDDSVGANYGDKLFKTSITLEKYKNSVPFNFDLAYALCDTLSPGEEDKCGVGESNTNIFKRTINEETVVEKYLETNKLDDLVSFTEYELENLVFDKDYRVNVYAVFDYYDKMAGRVVKRTLHLNRANNVYHLRGLDRPEFTATRKASYDSINHNYVIDFTVAVSDPSRVLENGNYFIKLLDASDNIVGDLQLMRDGNWQTIGTDGEYTELEDLKVLDAGEDIRISGLTTHSTYYKVVIYNMANFNNSDEAQPRKLFEKSYDVYTSEEEANIAFGSISPATTKNTLELRFIGGSNLVENVCSLDCTIGRWMNAREVQTFPLSYRVPEDKTFDEDTGNWRFVVDGGGLEFDEVSTYNARIVIKTCDRATGSVTGTFEFEKPDITYAQGSQ